MPTAHELPDPAGFSERLNACLERFGYGERGGGKRLADEFGVKAPVVSDWRRGRHLPAPAKVRQMAKAWRVPYDWLYWGEGPMPFGAALDQAFGTQNATRAGNLDSAVDDLRIAVSSLIALTAAKRPDEAAVLAKALRNQVPRQRLESGLLQELIAILDAAAKARPR